MSQPITIWVTPAGPNPWKVVMFAEELKAPYQIKSITFPETKLPPFIDLNPNGRVPAIEDPNTGITLWETGAILLYLVERYDVSKTYTYDSLIERSLCHQWLMFQISGQGPYFGQLAWFNHFHPEKVPSVITRFDKEMHRVLAVLETALKTSSSGWLVGDKVTYADMAFIWWNEMTQLASKAEKNPLDDYPAVQAWHKRMTSRPSFARTSQLRAEAMQQQNLGATGLQKGQTVQDLEVEVEKQKQKQGAS